MGEPIRIVLVDDHAVVRSALRLLLDAEDDLEVVAEAGDTESAIRFLRGHRPEVLILDRNLREGTTTAALPQLRAASPDTGVVVLTMDGEPAYAREALQGGVLAYVLKEAADSELVHAVRQAAAGRTYLQPELGARLAAEAQNDDSLSERELDTLRLLALGHTNTEIAGDLGISVRTVETHRSRIQQKLQMTKRSELVRYAIDRGLLSKNPG